MALVTALLLKRRWAYPAAILSFLLFLAYQLYRHSHTHSPELLVLSVVDVVVIVLTWLEYKRRPQFSVKQRTPTRLASRSGCLLNLLSGRVRLVAAGALEVPLSLPYALSGDERCSSAQEVDPRVERLVERG